MTPTPDPLREALTERLPVVDTPTTSARGIDVMLAVHVGTRASLIDSIIELVALAQPAPALERLRKMVNEQAEDDGLWFRAETAPEAYLQQELRRLHHAVEAVRGDPA